MGVYFTSDPHIGHAKVAGIRWQVALPGIDEDPNLERVIEWHDQILAQNWDARVGKDDVIWVLGDISAGGSKAQRNALSWLASRPGRKHLIAGNHDSVHPMHRDSHKWLPEYMMVFDSVQSAATRDVPLVDGGRQKVLLSHFPYTGEGGREGGDRHAQWRLRNEGLPIIHGHVHSTETVTQSSGEGADGWPPSTQIHVGVDAWGMKPVSLEEISEVLDR